MSIYDKNAFYSDYDNAEVPVVGDLNAAIAEYVLDSLRAGGYRPRDVRMGDEYFMFTHYPNSRNEFRLDRMWPGWRFGLWVSGEGLLDPEWPDDMPVVQLFCQHDSYIDKFKPSASELCVNLYACDLDERNMRIETPWGTVDPWAHRCVVGFADFIRMHPFLAYEGIMPSYPHNKRFVPYVMREIARDSYRRNRDRLAIAFWAKMAHGLGRMAVMEPEFHKYQVSNGGIDSWPPVELFVWPEPGVPYDELEAACDSAFPFGMSFGHRTDGSTVLWCKVMLLDGSVISE